MKRKTSKRENAGFTMVEMLAVVAITVILLGVSMVSVVHYRDLLKLTELDNAARGIYMAAENRAVLLSGARRLSNQVQSAGEPATLSTSVHEDAAEGEENLYYVSKEKMTENLLTAGSIDPALREGDFYVVYDEKSGSVTDVFYAEESIENMIENRGGFAEFYDDCAEKSRSERLRDKMFVGYYNGRSAQGEDLEVQGSTAIYVTIENGEELTVTVEYEAPAAAVLSVKLGNTGMTKSIDLPTARPLKGVVVQGGSISVPAGTGSYTWVLDSLTAGKFKDLWAEGTTPSVTPGDNFTVEAAITPQTADAFDDATARDSNNSLFQKESDKENAYIQNLRHLQNLNADLSGKKNAVQTADIYCHGDRAFEAYQDYNFTPITNENIGTYKGEKKEIRNLYVDHPAGDAGLFATTPVKMEIYDVCIVDAVVAAENDRAAGALVGAAVDSTSFQRCQIVNSSVSGGTVGGLAGRASGASLYNCWVYWETDENVTDLKLVLGSDAEGVGYKYQEAVSGVCAGGLVGEIEAGVTITQITNCLAATLVSGTDCAGGLAGRVDGSVTAEHSYADCYLAAGKTAGKAAGLIGDLTGDAKLTNCYAAGYITDGNLAAGLCLGSGSTTAENVYSVVRYSDLGASSKIFFLTENQLSELDGFSNTYFLGKNDKQDGDDDPDNKGLKSTSYADMISNGFVNTMNKDPLGPSFEKKTGDSHPYNLREHQTLVFYSFPSLTDLPHYGDWGAEFKEPSLVYYEKYSDGEWGVSGGNARDLIAHLSNNKTVLLDGYAVAFLQTDLKADAVTLKYTYFDENWVEVQSSSLTYTEAQLTKTSWTNDSGGSADYYMIPLPDDMVNSAYAQDCFYRYLSFELDLGKGEGEDSGKRAGEYFYNPHFAETVVPIVSDEGTEGGWNEATVTEQANKLITDRDENKAAIEVRTPRHLYDLSHFPEYYTRSSIYSQVLDLDYATYSGYDGKFQAKPGTPYVQQPIGTAEKPFAGTYTGAVTDKDSKIKNSAIENVVPNAEAVKDGYVGLFGRATGTLRNVTYKLSQALDLTKAGGQSVYAGALAGWNGGTIEDCEISGEAGVALKVKTSGSALYAGTLAGWNIGTIDSCAVTAPKLEAAGTSGSLYAGGLAGWSSGTLKDCTITEIADRPGVELTVTGSGTQWYAGGLVGRSSGTVAGCDVTAPKLTVTGESDMTLYVGGLAGQNTGTVDSCVVAEPELTSQPLSDGASSEARLYIGGLTGWNAGDVRNSAAWGSQLLGKAERVYAGGLVGSNRKNIRNCEAEFQSLVGDCSDSGYVYVGGMAGENTRNGTITSSYSVGLIRDDDEAMRVTDAHIAIGGFAGVSQGRIADCYAAVVRSNAENENASAFCKAAQPAGNNLYLDQGNFSYREESYPVQYVKDGVDKTDDMGTSATYKTLSETASFAGMGKAELSPQQKEGEDGYPYPAVLTNREGKRVHYGLWPAPMSLGDMGVFYWEKMVDASDSKNNPSYYMSVLLVDTEKKTITKQSTLPETHDDGRVVTEYGYGYYVNTDVEKELYFQEKDIGYLKYCDALRSNISNNGQPDPEYCNLEPRKALKDITPIPLAGSAGAAKGLKDQMVDGENFNFYCWTSYHEGGRPVLVDKNGKYGDMNVDRKAGTTQGLSLKDGGGSSIFEEGSGTFSLNLRNKGVEVVFGVNPLFADSVSVSSYPTDKLTPEADVPTGMPGKTETNPFKIRCGIQLQQLNWAKGAWTDVSIGDYTDDKYPYLSGPNGGEQKYFWKQTHDIDWIAEGNVYQWPTDNWKEGDDAKIGVFMGIAQTTVDSSNRAYGWFGGSYDGQNYTIKNLKISRNSSYYPNCMGMFGLVKGATLKNIVLFSETGNDVVTVEGKEAENNGENYTNKAPNAWYAGGVLAGVALRGDNGEGEITNCAVAGYTILDRTKRTRCTARLGNYQIGVLKYTATYTVNSYDIGGAIGGLVGMTDMPLKGCTASANIQISCSHRNAGDSDFGWRYRSMRLDVTVDESMVPTCVGGLVGSTTSTVTNCYTGGSIDVSGAQNASIYAGRIVGGAGAEPLGISGNEAAVSNCYSYLTLPNTSEIVKANYSIGGAGRTSGGNVALDNNYYLNSAVAGTGGGTAVTYLELSDKNTMLGRLKGGFNWVTTKEDGLSAAGRYSYEPQDRKDLQMRDYPFPTVLTLDAEETIRVHYGAWPLNGITRPKYGARPIELDMFTKWTNLGEDGKGETLELSEGVPAGGTWGYTIGEGFEDGYLDVTLTQAGELKVTALKPGKIPLTLTYAHPGGDCTPLTITVDVTDELNDLDGLGVSLFPNDVATLRLIPNGKDDKPLAAEGMEVTLEEPLVDGPLTVEKVEGDPTAIKLTLGEVKEDAAPRLSVPYTYTNKANGYSRSAEADITVEFLALPEGAWSEDVWTLDFSAETYGDLTITGVNAPAVVRDDKKAITLSKDGIPEEGLTLEIKLTMGGLDHTLTFDVLPEGSLKLRAAAAPSAIAEEPLEQAEAILPEAVEEQPIDPEAAEAAEPQPEEAGPRPELMDPVLGTYAQLGRTEKRGIFRAAVRAARGLTWPQL